MKIKHLQVATTPNRSFTVRRDYVPNINSLWQVVGARKLHQIKSTVNDWQQGSLPDYMFNEITALLEHAKAS